MSERSRQSGQRVFVVATLLLIVGFLGLVAYRYYGFHESGTRTALPEERVAEGEQTTEKPTVSTETPDEPTRETPSSEEEETKETSAPEVEESEEREASTLPELDGTGILTGTVKTKDGVPVSGATVWVVDPPERDMMRDPLPRAVEYASTGPNAVAVTTSDGTGAFRFTALPEGRFTLGVEHADYSRRFQGVRISEEPTHVDVVLQAGGTIEGRVLAQEGGGIEGALVQAYRFGRGRRRGRQAPYETKTDADGHFRLDGLRPGNHIVIATAEGRSPDVKMGVSTGKKDVKFTLGAGTSISGTIRDELTGKPVEKAKIRAQGEGRNWFGGRFGQATIEEDGTFHIVGLGPGSYRLVARAPGYPRVRVGPIKLKAGDEKTGVEVQLKPGGTIVGQILNQKTREPISDAFVYLQRQGRGMFGMIRSREMLQRGLEAGEYTTSGDEGRFTLESIPAGPQTVKAFHESFSPASDGVVVPVGGETSVELLLGPGATIRGRVVGPDGTPPTGRMFVSASGNGSIVPAEVSEEDGSYEIGGLLPGQYRVSLMRGRMNILRTADAQLTAGEERRIDFSLAESITLKGRLLRAGQPVDETRVRLWPESDGTGGGSDRTDEDGRFEIDELGPGSYRVFIDGTRHGDLLTIPSGKEEHEVTIELPGCVIKGTVATTGGTPVDDAQVTVFFEPEGEEKTSDDPLGSYVARTGSDKDGGYVVEGLSPGRYRLTASKDGYAQDEVFDVRLAGEGTEKLGIDFTLLHGATVRGTVRDTEGDPKPGATFWVERTDTGSVDVSNIYESNEDDGTYELNELGAGTWRITCAAGDRAPASETLELEVGDEVVLDFTLKPGATLFVLAQEGMQPVEGATVTLTHLEGKRLQFPIFFVSQPPHGPTDAQGRFVRSLLPDGPYRITVEKAGYETATVERSLSPGDEVTEAIQLQPTPSPEEEE